jgi:hypothetical protein
MAHFASEADRRHVPCGSYAASLVTAFAQNADAADWGRANEATRGADQPVLSCLRFILNHELQNKSV